MYYNKKEKEINSSGNNSLFISSLTIEEEKSKNSKDISNNLDLSFIVGEIIILKDNINKNIRIINSFEQIKREDEKLEKEEEDEDFNKFKNEIQIKSCEIKINGKNIPFNYFYKFKKSGKYKIEYIFNTQLTRTNHMFYNCSSLISLDFSHFNTKYVINMSNMFYGCSSLININLSNIKTYNVTNMNSMFAECRSLIYLDLSSFSALNASDISFMFSKCSSLINLDLSNFNTSNVTKMIKMFFECSSLAILDLYNFNISWSAVTDDMFYNCLSLMKNNNKRKVVIVNLKGFRIANKKEFFDSKDSIEDIKKYIQNETNIPISSQRLIYMGQQMGNSKILEEINKETYTFLFTIVLSQRINFKLDNMSLYLYNIDKQDCCITVLLDPYNDSIRLIEEKIKEKEKFENSEDFSVFIFPKEKRYLEEGDKLRYLIVKSSKKNPNDIKINIISINNRYEIYLKPNDKILEIKYRLLIVNRQQRLIYKGNTLEEEKTLEDYNIKDNEDIFISQILRG